MSSRSTTEKQYPEQRTRPYRVPHPKQLVKETRRTNDPTHETTLQNECKSKKDGRATLWLLQTRTNCRPPICRPIAKTTRMHIHAQKTSTNAREYKIKKGLSETKEEKRAENRKRVGPFFGHRCGVAVLDRSPLRQLPEVPPHARFSRAGGRRPRISTTQLAYSVHALPPCTSAAISLATDRTQAAPFTRTWAGSSAR